MNEVIIKNVSYGQLSGNSWLKDNDPYGLAAYVDENIRKTFIDNPCNTDEDKTAILLAVNNGDVVGRHLLYGTRIKDGDNIILAQSSGSTEVDISQRGKGIGSKINKYTLTNDEYPIYMCSLLSESCLSIMRKPENGCTIFDFPEFIRIINLKPALESRKIKGFLLKASSFVANCFLKLMYIPSSFRVNKLLKRYSIKPLDEVPKWIEEMCINDGHRYAEVHDVKWFQWNLQHNLSGNKNDTQYLFSICDENCYPVGFFLTKIRQMESSQINNIFCGVVCDWGTYDSAISEKDINLLAISTFPKKTYYVRVVANDKETAKQYRRNGLLRHGRMQMGIKDKLNQFPEMKDESKWRIRFGCCNSVLY